MAEKPHVVLLFLKINLNYASDVALRQACQKILLKPCQFAFFQLKPQFDCHVETANVTSWHLGTPLVQPFHQVLITYRSNLYK